MSSSILAVTSSPRISSNSEILLDHIIKGAQAAGGKVEKIRLSKLTIAGCRACNACKSGATCAIDDDMRPLLERVRHADAYAFASPIYMFSVSAQLKTFLDRWYGLLKDDWETAFRGRRAAVALTYGADDIKSSGALNALGMFTDVFNYLGLEFSGHVHASVGTGDVRRNPSVLAEAEALGRKLCGKS